MQTIEIMNEKDKTKYLQEISSKKPDPSKEPIKELGRYKIIKTIGNGRNGRSSFSIRPYMQQKYSYKKNKIRPFP